MNILALDLAIKTGWAHSSGPSGVQTFKPRRGDSPGMRWLEFRAWLCRVLDATPTDLIVYEQAHHQGGDATKCAYGWVTCVESVAAERSIELTVRHSHAIKRHGAGKGNADKKAVVAAARAKWPTVAIIDDNHADALWLLDLVQAELKGT